MDSNPPSGTISMDRISLSQRATPHQIPSLFEAFEDRSSRLDNQYGYQMHLINSNNHSAATCTNDPNNGNAPIAIAPQYESVMTQTLQATSDNHQATSDKLQANSDTINTSPNTGNVQESNNDNEDTQHRHPDMNEDTAFSEDEQKPQLEPFASPPPLDGSCYAWQLPMASMAKRRRI
eukprot:87121_1